MTINKNTNTVGWRIRKLRYEKLWSQAYVAKRLNLSISAFCKIEVGITDITMTRLKQIAELYEIPAYEIIKEDDKYTPLYRSPEAKRLYKVIEEKDKKIAALLLKVVDLNDKLHASSSV